MICLFVFVVVVLGGGGGGCFLLLLFDLTFRFEAFVEHATIANKNSRKRTKIIKIIIIMN